MTRAKMARWDERAEVVPGTVNVSLFDGMQAGSEWGEDVLRDCGGGYICHCSGMIVIRPDSRGVLVCVDLRTRFELFVGFKRRLRPDFVFVVGLAPSSRELYAFYLRLLAERHGRRKIDQLSTSDITELGVWAQAMAVRRSTSVAEAGPNAVATFGLHRNGTITALDTAATGQAATCWIVYANGTFYASNPGSGTVSAYHAGAGGKLTAQGTTRTDAGTVDAAVSGDGHHLYVQTGAKGIVDAYRINANGSLTATGSVTVANTAGGEGIAAN